MFYRELENKRVRCELCPRGCIIANNTTGFCRVRKNVNGILYSLNYGKAAAIAIDPIEKKPLFHFAPGSQCLSFATVGCNLRCKFCQNWQLSQEFDEVYGEEIEPEHMVELAMENGVEGIAYTYTEPTIFYEYAYDVMRLAKKNGLYNVWVSNGYTNKDAVKRVSKYMDAINVDIKGDERFYRTMAMVPDIRPIFNALKEYKECGVWIETTTLIIPGYNDSKEAIENIVLWIKKNLGESTPIHFSAFHPDYKLMDIRSTPLHILERAYSIAKNMGMRYVYIGNVFGHKNESTYCWKCGNLLIKRYGFHIVSYNERCNACGEEIRIAGKKWMKAR